MFRHEIYGRGIARIWSAHNVLITPNQQWQSGQTLATEFADAASLLSGLFTELKSISGRKNTHAKLCNSGAIVKQWSILNRIKAIIQTFPVKCLQFCFWIIWNKSTNIVLTLVHNRWNKGRIRNLTLKEFLLHYVHTWSRRSTLWPQRTCTCIPSHIFWKRRAEFLEYSRNFIIFFWILYRYLTISNSLHSKTS